MSVLVDTNILLRVAQIGHPDRLVAKQALLTLSEAGIALHLVPQVIYEFWVVATRPTTANGFGMDVPSAERSVHELLLEDFNLLLDERGIYRHWQSLVTAFDVKGKKAHDARLVAAMRRHGVEFLLTFNQPDFSRFPDITAIAPAERVAGTLPAGLA